MTRRQRSTAPSSRITAAELQAPDAYEVEDYTRIEVPLRSGGTAWVYVFAGGDERS
jgi:hypothetical protein